MAEHKTRAQDAQTGVPEKKDTKQPMSDDEAKAKGHLKQEQKGHSKPKGKGATTH